MRKRIQKLLYDDDSIYGRLMSIVIVVSLLPLCVKNQSMVLSILEYACVAIFLVDYVMRWITADFLLGKGKASFVLYPFTPMALIDLLSMLPTFISINSAWRAIRILRLFRALRAFRLIRYSKSIDTVARVFTKQRDPLVVVTGLAAAYIVVSALVIFNVEPDTFESYFDALYWAVVSLTTVGYGDLFPTTDIGRAVAMISALMGIAVIALPSGIITAGLMEEINARQAHKREAQASSPSSSEHSGGEQGPRK
ncbi:ion transporter [Arcanobacterium haemolyticum]|nr:ion transporter [Arcanobacterium haemolyticum]